MSNDLTADQWTTLVDKVNAAAKRVAGQWPDVVTAEDLAQDMLVDLLESPGTLSRIFSEDEQTQGSFLIKIGHRIASQEQIDFDRFSGNYLYDYAEVRLLLEAGALTNVEARTFAVAEVDLREAAETLADQASSHYAEIVNRFVQGIIPDRTDKTGHSRVRRAVEALTEKMNRIGKQRRKEWTDGPGSRKVISNSLGQYQSHNNEAGP